jgi:hypothetical protein
VPGAGLLAVTGAIHLDLDLTGYRSIPVIGWLFLLQVITAFSLAAAVLVSGSRLAAMAGAGFALSTLGGRCPKSLEPGAASGSLLTSEHSRGMPGSSVVMCCGVRDDGSPALSRGAGPAGGVCGPV